MKKVVHDIGLTKITEIRYDIIIFDGRKKKASWLCGVCESGREKSNISDILTSTPAHH